MGMWVLSRPQHRGWRGALFLSLWAFCAGAQARSAPTSGQLPIEGGWRVPGEVSGGRLQITHGQRLIVLDGPAYDRGYAEGHLLRGQILDLLGEYAVPEIGRRRYAKALAAFLKGAQIPAHIRAEARGVIDGLKATGGARLAALGRDLTADDLLLLNAYTELSGLGCSSMSAWGPRSDSGALRLVRQLDWSEHPALLRNQIITLHRPGEGRAAFASVGFAGYLGCLSCLGESGLGVFFNMAGRSTSPAAFAGGFVPGGIALRQAVEAPDGSVERLDAGLHAAAHAGAYIVHAVAPPDHAAIFEISPDQVRRRGAADDPQMSGALAATNHHRVEAPPTTCRRYDALRRANAGAPRWDRAALWRLGAEVALPQVVHQILVEPEARWMQVRLRGARGALTDAPSVEYDLSGWGAR